MRTPAVAARVAEEETRAGVPATQATGTELAVVDLGEDAGAGLEGLRVEEQLTPFLRILQAGSPQVNDREPDYVEGAKSGALFNTATQEVYDGREGVQAVFCARDYHYGLWLPRDLGGGFRGMIPPDDDRVRRLVAKYGRFKLPRFRDNQWRGEPLEVDGEKVEVVETIQLYALYAPYGELSEQTAQRAIISFTSTALPVATAYLTRHNSWRFKQPNGDMLPAQLWAYPWKITTVPQSNASGNWFNYRIDLDPPGVRPPPAPDALLSRTSPLYQLAREFYQLHKAGQVKPDYEGAAATGEGGGEEIPF